MKIKIDFVTNSSSGSFLMVIPKDLKPKLLQHIEQLDKEPDNSNEGVRYHFMIDNSNIREFQEYVNDGPFDWASLPGGPRFENLSERTYNKIMKIIEANPDSITTEVWVDYNGCEEFDEMWREYVMEYGP